MVATVPKPFLRSADFTVGPADFSVAQQMVRENHYARGCANTAVYVHGLFEKATGRLLGCALWMPPTRVCAESVNRPDWKRVLTLSRLVCLPDAPKNAASFLQARSIDLIRRDGRFVSLVTYADEGQGHLGQIYRATNWLYVGRTGPYPMWHDPSTGRQVARLSTKSRTASQMRDLGYTVAGNFFKHKFVKHL